MYQAIATVVVAILAFVIFSALVLASQPSPSPNAQIQIQLSPTRDPAYRVPDIEEFAKKYPKDWEQRLYPDIRAMVQFQRMIGEHATVVSYSDQQRSSSNPTPKVRVFIAEWDGTDLFAGGVPKTYHGKPVELVPVQGQTQPGSN